ncbi:MAG: hypothetical protein ACFB8W_10740, partial [Elainellaceae cyanobacterium]
MLPNGEVQRRQITLNSAQATFARPLPRSYGGTARETAEETTMHWATALMSTNISHRSSTLILLGATKRLKSKKGDSPPRWEDDYAMSVSG